MKSQISAHALPAMMACALYGFASATSAQETDPGHGNDRRHGDEHEHGELEEIIVTATPIGRDVVELSQSATVLQGDNLAREAANNLGDSLSRLPGLADASFGQNVGRPVIRGQQGVRVGVLNDGMTSFDAAAVSQDHAVPTEPFLADAIEVLRGPSTLLYGSGAIGGVVNVVTHTIPASLPEDGIDGRIMVQGDSAADQRMGAGRLDFGAGNFAFHASGFVRRTDDYEIPGAAELYPEEDHEEDSHDEEDHHDDHEEEEIFGLLENSFLDNEGGALGAAWITDGWRLGLSWTEYDSDYGIPGAHAHEHGEEEEHDDHEGEDEHEHEEEEEENVTIGLESRRLDAVLGLTDPLPGFTELEVKFADTEYAHTEFEGAEVGTQFDSETQDFRLELSHAAWGAFEGTFGAQWSDNDFIAIGEEAFVPPSQAETVGLFWVESAEFGALQLDLGVRWEDTAIDSFLIEHEHDEDHEDGEHHEDEGAEPASRNFNPFSVSAGLVWHLNDRSHLAFSLSRAERAPASAELFSNGPHIATQTFEVGDPNLGVERNTHYELSYRVHQGPVTGSLTIYHDDFDDYIYEADTGEMEDGLPERVWTQQDAEFTGGELELRWDLGHFDAGHFQLFGFYDQVRATLADGSAVPRIPPKRFGLGLDWDLKALAANFTWINAQSHNRNADFETPTPGYDLVNADLAWLLPLNGASEWEVYLQGRNLLDEDIRNSTSFLKDQAPQIGRNFVLGVRGTF